MPAEQTNIKVAVRVRPYNKRELEQNQRCIIKVLDHGTILFDPDVEDDEFFFQGAKQNYRDITKRINKKLTMDFDRVFDTESTNQDLFNECTSPLVDAVLNGYNCSVFVYGATGAGKTFTMLGNENCPGITFLTMQDLFKKISSQEDERKFDVGVSYLEVYNEQVMNLLTKTGPLKLREDASGVVVSGLVLTPIYSAEELLRLLALGNSNRTQHPTDANAESSRSHAIFQVHIRMTERKTGTKRTVKLSMIDLAGSERAASTKGIGARFKEGASINKSLLALGNCINKLADGLKHIPYRDSNLTRILKDSLGGNCRTLMVANVSMSSLTYEDTYNTLKYASRAKKIRTTLRQNAMKSNMPKEFYVKKVNEIMAENERLLERNKMLETKVISLEKCGGVRVGFNEMELKPWYSKIDTIYAVVQKAQEYVINIRSRVKSLTYKETLRSDFEDFRKILTVDQRTCEEDIFRFSAYLANLIDQRKKLKEELPRYRKKLLDAEKDLDKLKREIKESKQFDILQLYLKLKDSELQNALQNMSYNHLRRINTELGDNSDMLRKALTSACQMAQLTYEHLEKTQKLTPDIQKLFERLQRNLRDVTNNEKDPSTSSQSKRLHTNQEDMDDNEYISTETNNHLCPAKRQKAESQTFHNFDLEIEKDSSDDSDSDGEAKEFKFKAPYNFNETQIISSNGDFSCYEPTPSQSKSALKPTNQHKSLSSAAASLAAKARSVNQRLVTEMLSEQNVRASSNKEKIKQVLLKSNNFSQQELQRTMAAAIQKENLKMNTNCVRKSPRAIVAKTLAGTSSLARKPTARVGNALTSSKEAPVVRINRAASFRVRK